MAQTCSCQASTFSTSLPRSVSAFGRKSSIVCPLTATRKVARKSVNCVYAPVKPLTPSQHRFTQQAADVGLSLISRDTLRGLEGELDTGLSIAALRRFDTNLRNLTANNWEEKLRPVMHELAYNLESFNPAFTATLLKVQSCIGLSDYVSRDLALKNLIQPLAGEYGMHNGEAQAKTHRELFSEFYEDLLDEPLETVLSRNPRPAAAVQLHSQMMRDILGDAAADPVEQAAYALGYNLAIEYLADYEKTWMLDAFRVLNKRVLEPQSRGLTEWVFLEVHAEGEAEHAAIGHTAVASFVSAQHEGILRKAMRDHDRDFSVFYNKMADLLE